MEPIKVTTSGPGNSVMIDLPFENDIDQDEYNRTRRKPGVPPCDPNAKWLDPAPAKSSTTPPATTATPNKTEASRHCITVDAIPEDEERQDELNRIRRKPGDPPYNPNAKWHDPPVVPPNGAQQKPADESQKS
jgi:hypothetical protein